MTSDYGTQETQMFTLGIKVSKSNRQCSIKYKQDMNNLYYDHIAKNGFACKW